MRDQEKAAKPHQLAQTGWCGPGILDHTTPSAPLKEASLLLLDVAATPPPAEEGSLGPYPSNLLAERTSTPPARSGLPTSPHRLL